MQKIFYALNHKATEDAITMALGEDFSLAGAVTYREAVLTGMQAAPPDVLVIRDTLAGTIDITYLAEKIRLEYPNTRVVCICACKEKTDPFLHRLVSLGIYDIINQDEVPVSTVVSYIMNPRTFRDVAQYFLRGEELAASEPEKQKESKTEEGERHGLFGSLFKRNKQAAPALEKQPDLPALEAPSVKDTCVDVELLREAIMEEAERKAQINLDQLVKEAAERLNTELMEALEKSKKNVQEMQSRLELQAESVSSSQKQYDAMKVQYDTLSQEYQAAQEQTSKTIAVYENQIRSLNQKEDTPSWYLKQSKEWEDQKAELTQNMQSLKESNETLRDQLSQLHLELDFAKTQASSLKNELKNVQSKGSFQDIDEAKKKMDEAIKDALEAREKSEEESQRASSIELELTECQSRWHMAEEENERLSLELKEIKQELSEVLKTGLDISDADSPIVLPDTVEYTAAKGAAQTILFLGAKHGVGSTTAALNAATLMAGRGYKTLLIEMNDRFPLLNEYFEFLNIRYGLDTACQSILSSDKHIVDSCIIKPHALHPQKRELAKAYKKMPGALHFMLYSNDALLREKHTQSPGIKEDVLHALFNYLIIQQKYSYIFVDIQVDDTKAMNLFFNANSVINKLVMSMTQDPHSISSAGYLISDLAKTKSAGLAAHASYLINRFQPTAKLNIARIAKYLNLGQQQFVKLTEDSSGYLNSAGAGIPYVLNRGRLSSEYDSLTRHILG